MNPSLSLYSSAFDATSHETITLQDAIHGIMAGKWKVPIEKFRAALGSVDEKTAKQLKCALPAFTTAGVFSRRDSEHLKRYSHIVCVDVDKVGANCAQEIRAIARSDPHVMAAFISPSGNGVKLFFQVTSDNRQHTAACTFAAQHVRRSYAAFLGAGHITDQAVDPKVGDLPRLCFVSYDVGAFCKTDALPLDVPHIAPARTASDAGLLAGSGDNIDGSALESIQPKVDGFTLDHARAALALLDPDMSYSEWRDVAAALRHQFTGDLEVTEAFEIFDQWSAVGVKYDDGGTSAKALWESLKSAPRTGPPVTIRSIIKRAQAAGWIWRPTLKSENRKLEQLLNSVRFDAAKPPPNEPWRFKLAGVEVSTPGNIVVVSAPIKSGKTSFIAAGVAAALPSTGNALPGPDGKPDCLGWESDGNPEGRAVLHFDTEQSREDHHRTIQVALARVGLTVAPDWLSSWCLTGESAATQLAAIVFAAEQLGTKRGIHSIWIDGIADLVSSPNEEAECNELVQRLRNLAIAAGAPIICSLHFNPGSEKTRGHLGSELERKAQSVLCMSKDKDSGAIQVTMPDKSRRAPIHRDGAPLFNWSPFHGMHMSIPRDAVERRRPGAPRKHDVALILGADVLSSAELRARALKAGVSESSFYRLLSEALEKGELERLENGLLCNPQFALLQ